MSSFAERKRIAQELAQRHVLLASSPPNRSGHSDVICGLQIAASITGFTNRQLVAIEDTAHRWAAQNCPRLAGDPRACLTTCPSACLYVPMPAKHWR